MGWCYTIQNRCSRICTIRLYFEPFRSNISARHSHFSSENKLTCQYLESVDISQMFSFQSSDIHCAKLYAPEADSFATDSDASLGQKIFDIPMA